MRVAIYGAGRRGEYVARNIKECKNAKVEVFQFIDNNPAYLNKQKFGIPIVELGGVKNFDRNECVIVASELFTAQEMAVSLLNKGYHNAYIIPEEVFDGELPILNKDGSLMKYIRHMRCYKPCLPYLEYHVSDYCNLKCKGCGHFSNIVTNEKFPSIVEFRSSLNGLSKKFSNVKTIRLMGGEPFLNLDLDLFIYEARRAFPYSDVRIVTNGLILPKISKNIIKAIRECGAVVDISQYPPTREFIENIVCFAYDNHLKIQIGAEIEEFFAALKQNTDTMENAEKVFSDCISKTCYFLRDKRLYPCPVARLLYENKDFLKLDISRNDVINNSFDLIDGREDGWEVLRKLFYPNEFCKYCTEKKEFAWCISRGEVKREDWMVNNNEM
jgi:organic radical activating enzyme